MIIEYATKQKTKERLKRAPGLREMYRELLRNRIRKLAKDETYEDLKRKQLKELLKEGK